METYLSVEGLAKYLGIAEKTARKWVLNRAIPYHKIMKTVRFRVSEIERWIEAGGKFQQGNDAEGQDGDLLPDGEAGDEKGIETVASEGSV